MILILFWLHQIETEAYSYTHTHTYIKRLIGIKSGVGVIMFIVHALLLHVYCIRFSYKLYDLFSIPISIKITNHVNYPHANQFENFPIVEIIFWYCSSHINIGAISKVSIEFSILMFHSVQIDIMHKRPIEKVDSNKIWWCFFIYGKKRPVTLTQFFLMISFLCFC